MLRGALVVAAVAIAVSVNTLAGGLVWDDLIQIVGNPWIQEPPPTWRSASGRSAA